MQVASPKGGQRLPEAGGPRCPGRTGLSSPTTTMSWRGGGGGEEEEEEEEEDQLPASTGRRPGPRRVLPPRGRGGGRPCTDRGAELAHLERDEDGGGVETHTPADSACPP
ncbi:unnamed protein product [Prorocentrum cordatum]|uniref:Uncharacterized protein n=1 Tax=Prorocentrum cordatum TaxID=2364126 RepID=A0ABN9RNS7_9DINO|nr:unnamed protein product [Polarella glacialis]